MNLVPRSPIHSLPVQDGDQIAAPVLEIDADAGFILGANAAGWEAFGMDPESNAPPVAIDRAMPALERLRAIAGGGETGACQSETLTFWTARGLLQLTADVEALGSGARFTVRATRTLPAAGAAALVDETDGVGAAQEIGLPARLAHELRTPLSAVIAYAEVLKDEHFGPLANARYRTYAQDIYQSARHALGVVDAMLGDPKQAGTRQLAFTDLEPAVVVEGCVAVARPLAEGAGLILEADYAPGLPRVVADEISLTQMLLNLLTNAIKFGRRGDRVSVVVACAGDGPLEISVADTGPGLVAEPACGAGAPASGSASAMERCPKGLGLGLPLTRALAAANGASFSIESEPGQGTRATISFAKDRLVPV
jgi:two-component system, cell cycle sensor histidine kinase PleC